MSQTNICIRTDATLKKQFDEICSELGLTMSTALNMLIKNIVREKRIPVDLSLHTPNKETRKVLDEVNQGMGLSKVYDDIDEMFRDMELESDNER